MRILLSLYLSLFLSIVFAQDLSTDLPDAINKSFNKKFPRAENVNWELVDGNYKADFIYKEKQTYVEYNSEGNWVITITREDLKTVYTPVRNYLEEYYSKDKIILIEKA